MNLSPDVLALNPGLADTVARPKRRAKRDKTPRQPKPSRPFPADRKLTPSLFVSGLDRYHCPTCTAPLVGVTRWTAQRHGARVQCAECAWLVEGVVV